jgi:hypothetical protein
MTNALNLYGDSLMKTTGKHGADISGQRMDDLDIETIVHAAKLADRKGAAIDLGCGFGAQALRLAALGYKTLMMDFLPVDMTVLRVAGLADLLPISYLMKDARTVQGGDLPSAVVICYSQRFIHYLRADEAVTLLKVIRANMSAGAKLFMSASGLLSELGDGYAGKSLPLATRYSALAPAMAEKHNIHEPVCLYTQQDLVAICGSASFSCDRVYASAFGNIKGIFSAE